MFDLQPCCTPPLPEPPRLELRLPAAPPPFILVQAAPRARSLADIQANRTRQQRFLSRNSPWNQTLPAEARYEPVPGIGEVGGGLTSWHPDWASVAIYYALPDDPLVQVRWLPDTWSGVNDGTWKRSGNTPEVEAQILAASQDVSRYPGNPYSTQHADRRWGAGLPDVYARWQQPPGEPLRIRLPAGAVPPPEPDGHVAVVQPDGRALELYGAIALSNGTWVAMTYSFTDALGGLGVGAQNGRRASMLPNYAGVITDAEAQAGVIEHALVALLPPGLLTEAFVPPALAFDNEPNYGGTLPMGARLALPRGLDLGGLGLRSATGRMLAKAAQDYGVIVGDRGGGGISLVTEYAPRSELLTRWGEAEQADLDLIVRQLQRVR